MTSKYIKLILDDETISVFNCPFYKEIYDTEIGIDDSKSRGLYFTRSAVNGLEESWEEQGNVKDGVYLATANYKAIAWFPLTIDAERVAATIVATIQKNRGYVTGIIYNPRDIYLEETGEQWRNNELGLVSVQFELRVPVSVRDCNSQLLCLDDFTLTNA